MTDLIGPDAKLVWAQDEAGEIGKRPVLESHLFEISAETFGLVMERLEARNKGGKRK